ncbi:hypothetical protein DOTSEDRAFT_69701 [Dothistroma septosporum NZE10]|uniref:Uncharacterized protein n=1 Tax=Dothistroma septosporum (strain NZE10 / CBS 128990) TaxID=675120 RepID=N1PWS0_DOTSN|nr:hypothetical protein DOTSEDRAFT_69701 [Dothistroma septosporum NZE10]
MLHCSLYFTYQDFADNMTAMQHQCNTKKKFACLVCALKALTTIYWHGENKVDFVQQQPSRLDGPFLAQSFESGLQKEPS